MVSPVVDSSFDVAYWFIDRALNENEYLQPQKLHRLMFLAQAYFAVAYNSRMLMPAIFVADEFGPLEPNVYRACAIQRPAIEPHKLPDNVVHFLDSIWRRFGANSADYLSRQVRGHAPFRDAVAKGPGSIISLESMIDYYGKKVPESPGIANAPSIQQVLRPRVMRSQSGRPVSVKKWMPPVKPAAAASSSEQVSPQPLDKKSPSSPASDQVPLQPSHKKASSSGQIAPRRPLKKIPPKKPA